ncbi:unnamed protein product, partial [Rhizoctonia solani]
SPLTFNDYRLHQRYQGYGQAEYRNPEGRIYWYNTQTKASSWEKPEELKTPFERAMAQTPWKEHTSQGRKYWYHRAMAQTPWKEHTSQGRKYWYHSQTKESKWEMPQELVELMDKVNKENPMPVGLPPRPGAPNFIPGPITHGDGLPAVPGLPINPTLALVGPGGMRPGPGLMPQQPFIPNNPAGSGSPLPTRPNMPDDPIVPPGGFPTHDEAEKAFAHL